MIKTDSSLRNSGGPSLIAHQRVPREAAVTVAVVPARNEEDCVGAVVATLLAAGLGRVRVVDNGSTDQTATAARNAGAELFVEPIAGYGRAC
ncbi:MAG: glycosyltransferase, partial [Bryobacteraceae bacterium]